MIEEAASPVAQAVRAAEESPSSDDPRVLFPRPLTVLQPKGAANHIVLTSPHSGRIYPETFVAASRLDAVTLRRSEDSFVDELIADAVDLGSPVLLAEFPRAYLDVNREPYELDPAMFDSPLPAHANTRSLRVSAGLGTIARLIREGVEIYRAKLSVEEAESRIDALYRPYHAALRELLEAAAHRWGASLLLDCHSMPSLTLPGGQEIPGHRADIVLGDRFGVSCAPVITRTAETFLRGRGLKVERNRPYAGGYSTETYGRPREGSHALQIEINRALYMDEERIERRPDGLAATSRLLTDLTASLAEIPLELLAPRR